MPTLEERSDTFTHPGPTSAGEYYVHNVCGVVKALIKGNWEIRYLVRWTVWEDRYNTIKPLFIICRTAAFFSFKLPNIQTGISASKPSLARRLVDITNENCQTMT